MPPTVDGFLLLGWMERDDAIRWLTKDCWFEPPMTDKQAEELWETYRSAVQGLPERMPGQPIRLPIPPSREQIVTGFLAKVRGPEVMDVINIDPLNRLVYQLYVVGDRADHHARQLGGNQWARACLQTERPTCQMPLRLEDGAIKVDLPHAEHFFALQPPGFQIQQGVDFLASANLKVG